MEKRDWFLSRKECQIINRGEGRPLGISEEGAKASARDGKNQLSEKGGRLCRLEKRELILWREWQREDSKKKKRRHPSHSLPSLKKKETFHRKRRRRAKEASAEKPHKEETRPQPSPRSRMTLLSAGEKSPKQDKSKRKKTPLASGRSHRSS